MGRRVIIGYVGGVFDLFHYGHSRLLAAARERCDRLMVGVTIDSVAGYKGREPVMSFAERAEVVASILYVDEVVEQVCLDKIQMWRLLGFDRLFVGSDWRGSPSWRRYENTLSPLGVDVVFLPYTEGVSSTAILARVRARSGIG